MIGTVSTVPSDPVLRKSGGSDRVEKHVKAPCGRTETGWDAHQGVRLLRVGPWMRLAEGETDGDGS